MKLQFENKATGGRLIMTVNDLQLKGEGMLNGQNEPINTLVINKSTQSQNVIIDEIAYTMPGHSVLPLVSNQHFIFEKPETLVAWQFNREFYCIVDHDAEVGCVGFLFFGIHHPMFIKLNADDLKSISIIEQLSLEDMQQKDRMQGEMLRTLLKRLIIKSTRMAKAQLNSCQQLTDERLDIIRKFNLLLEVHFKQQHEVNFYAKALNKSPKTLTNFFRLCNYPSPSSLIHQRIILEAKRYLNYTDKSGKEIAYKLGFESPAHFSRFFKLKTGNNLSEFRSAIEK
jgi:AraC family transcriptional regulator, transcriptional activator of pobA